MTRNFDPGPVLGGLKDFQLETVEYVFRRFYGPRPTKRFLVADEVGLGKTLVARGLIAKTIEHLQRQGKPRIDIVYVCSNADIARQNINRLNVTGNRDFNLPTRLTLLPLHLRRLRDHGLNFISFTPGTAFDLKSRGGLAKERALLYRLLQYAWGRRGLSHKGIFNLLRCTSGLEAFKNCVSWTPAEVGTTEGTIDVDLACAFKEELERDEEESQARGEPSLHERFLYLADRNRRSLSKDWGERFEMVGELRTLLARSCVRALEADLIILDEFQRFRDLLDGRSDAAELAHQLFDEAEARVLLLSATPYKMYTLAEEREEDHFEDFVRTARFLMGPERTARFREDLRAFRHALLSDSSRDLESVMARKQRVERHLRSVMVRTERLGVTEDRDGMLVECPSEGVRLEPADLRAYVTAERVSRHLGTGDALEYWKSGSYILNFMESYKVKRELRTAVQVDARGSELAKLFENTDGLLRFGDLKRYRQIDPGNARLRALIADTVDNEAWRLLWLPPSLPSYRLKGPFNDPLLTRFTKRLVFSSWNLVPQVIATLVSYEVERRMMRLRSRRLRNTPEARKRMAPLLRFGKKAGRLSGMSLLGILYPSPSLARLGDPLALAAGLEGGETPPQSNLVLSAAADRIRAALDPLIAGRPIEGPADEAWYWAAPLLLDHAEDAEGAREWFHREGLADVWAGTTGGPGSEHSLLEEHVEHAKATLDDPSHLGRVPDDLVPTLAQMAVGGPATCALRAFARVCHGTEDFTSSDVRDGAARVGWGFRSLFNIPEVMALVRSVGPRDQPYWVKVLDYCVAGGLDAVLAEYAHVLRESLGFLEREPELVVGAMAEAMNEALSVRAASYSADEIQRDEKTLSIRPRKLRARYALRFGAQSLEDDSQLQRAGTVRTAFNSPFWPFVLATTSIGQEGLDFHQYCHAVVHWNLPANPVDLEQREGRVHRYKGHAIRKNLAAAHRADAFDVAEADPWQAMFEAARSGRPSGTGDLVPYWIFTGGDARIERYVPALPLSREIEALTRLKRSLAAYRLAFGQPRQEDLIELISRVREEGLTAQDVAALVLDLSPRQRAAPRSPTLLQRESGS